MILLAVCAGVAKAQPAGGSDYSEASATKWTAHFKSQQEISQFLDGWYLRANSGDAEKPMTRFDFVDIFYFHLDRLTNLAAFKLKLKTSEEFYAFARKNPAYAINFPVFGKRRSGRKG